MPYREAEGTGVMRTANEEEVNNLQQTAWFGTA